MMDMFAIIIAEIDHLLISFKPVHTVHLGFARV